jgi:hypothetical protein
VQQHFFLPGTYKESRFSFIFLENFYLTFSNDVCYGTVAIHFRLYWQEATSESVPRKSKEDYKNLQTINWKEKKGV